ncbi:hypothetical protein CBM2589_B120365 [Cupriavidus taiwanensis]|uniref:Uncharacterized protein n=1 Tax=Cupriavidus taiwanensis TaxID=164546 RepID=A0A975ZY65_9BURK|nr:hypothetical protein CBM2589_B120365 [Cupriavidus taiwanensis]
MQLHLFRHNVSFTPTKQTTYARLA